MLSQGRLSEVLGEDYLELDVLMRSMKFFEQSREGNYLRDYTLEEHGGIISNQY